MKNGPILIQRAAYGTGPTAQYVGVDHGSLNVFVSEQSLHGANVVASFEQVSQELVDFGHAHLLWMPDIMKEGELAHPIDVGCGSTGGVMLQTDLIA